MTAILPGALPPAAGGAHADERLKFNGDGVEFVGLCVRGALLQLVTFGFYRFWLATDIRRHLWSHSLVAGETLEYTGRGRELLIGFLIALAIIVPVQLVYFFIGIEAERLQAFASLPLFIFFVLFGQFALFRARRYRLTRTIWRGVRFWMTGSGWKYAFRWLGWALVALLTLGLAYPWMRASLERYKMSNTYYGDLEGEFVGSPMAFFKRGIWLWLLAFVPAALLLSGMAGTYAVLNWDDLEIVRTESAAVAEAGSWLSAIGGVAALVIPFVWPFFRALEWRWWADGVRFGALSLASNIGGGTFLKIYIKLILMAILVLTGMSIVIGGLGFMVFYALGIHSPDASIFARLSRNIPLILSIVVVYLVVLLAVSVVQRFYLTREMWRAIFTSLTVSHLEAADGVAARGEAVNALGEGLADGLDVAGF